MDLLAYWRWKDYVTDLHTPGGVDYKFSSNQSRLHSILDTGDNLWVVTGKHEAGTSIYVLVARLNVKEKLYNAPNNQYGKYAIRGDKKESEYYSANGPDMSDLLLQLEFKTKKSIASKARIGQALQTMRELTPEDTKLLWEWAKTLRLEPQATPSGA